MDLQHVHFASQAPTASILWQALQQGHLLASVALLEGLVPMEGLMCSSTKVAAGQFLGENMSSQAAQQDTS